MNTGSSSYFLQRETISLLSIFSKKKEIKFKFFNVTLGNLHDDYDDDNKSLALP